MKQSLISSAYKRFIKFGIVGTSGILANNFVLWLLVELSGLPFYLCSLIAIETAILNNFLLNDAWTWADRKSGSKIIRFLKYNASTAFSSIFINISVLMFFKEWVGLPYIISNLIGIGFGMLVNFLINHYWTFGDYKIKQFFGAGKDNEH